MMEAGVVIVGGEAVFWHLPPGRTGGSLPDSRDLWDVLWEHRADLDGFAHSHPGHGWPGPSQTDVTTFLAIERALGRRLKWWITSRTNMVLLAWTGDRPDSPIYGSTQVHGAEEPGWIWKLREHSYVKDPAVGGTIVVPGTGERVEVLSMGQAKRVL